MIDRPFSSAGWPSKWRSSFGRPDAGDGEAVAAGLGETMESPRLRDDVAALTALSIAVLVVVWINESAHLFLSRIDTLTFYVPWYGFLGDRLRAGDIPGWMPYTMSGVPFAGDPQSGWGYLPAMVLMTLIPGAAGFKALILFHLLLAAGASYCFARLIGLNIAGGLVAAAVFTFPGMLERVRCCTIHVQVAVWIPVAFIGIELSARERSLRGRLVWWTITGIAVSQIVAGWIGQGAAYGLLTVAAYAAYRYLLVPPSGMRDWRARVRVALLAALSIGGVAAILAATAVLPRIDVVDRSNLSGGSYSEIGESAETTGGWSVGQLVDRMLTDDDRQGRWYLGVAAVALATLAPVVARRRYRLAFFMPFAFVVLLLILNPTPVHRVFYLIPSFQQFHEHRQDRILTVFPLALAIMAGAVVATVTERRFRRLAAVLALLPAAGALAIRQWRPAGHDPITRDALIVVLVVSAALALAMSARRAWLPRLAAAAILLAIVWDPALQELASQQNRGIPSLGASVHAYQHDDSASRFLRERMDAGEVFRYVGYDPAWLTLDGTQRTYHIEYRDADVLALIVNNRAIPLGLQDVQGYNPIQILRYAEFMEQLNGSSQSYHAANVLFRGATSPLLNLLNVRYMIVPREVAPGRPDLLHLYQRYPVVYQDDRVRILERTDHLPRAWIVHRVVAAADDAAFRHLDSPDFDAAAEAILPEGATLPALSEPIDPAAEHVEVTAYAPDRIELRVEMSADGLVVLSEIWDPDWHVEIDGKPAELYRVDTLLRGVAVPAGSHTVVLTHRSTTLLASAAVSGAGWLAILTAGIWLLGRSLRARRPRRPGHDQKREIGAAHRARAFQHGGETRSDIDPPGTLIERGDGQAKTRRVVPPAPLGEHSGDERFAESAAGQIRAKTQPDIEQGLGVRAGAFTSRHPPAGSEADEPDQRASTVQNRIHA